MIYIYSTRLLTEGLQKDNRCILRKLQSTYQLLCAIQRTTIAGCTIFLEVTYGDT